MSRDSSINKTSVLIVAIVVGVGIFSTMGDYTDSSWAGAPYPTDGYEKIDGRYVWETTLAEKSQGYEWLGFETVNGKVTIQPHEKETDQVEVKAIVKIKKKFWGSEESVMDAKK
ncbi:hypothetical protein GF373_02000, partial [bacterium]|nr:hypothetical protein [bacterium]